MREDKGTVDICPELEIFEVSCPTLTLIAVLKKFTNNGSSRTSVEVCIH